MNRILMAEQLKATLEEERELLDYFVDEEEKLRLFVSRKDWIGVDSALRELQGLADDVVTQEKERQSQYEQLCVLLNRSTEDTFYRVTVDIPDPELRMQLNGLFRGIKVSLLRLKGVTTGLGLFVADKEKTIQELLGEIVPQSRGTVYSRDGRSRRGSGSDVKLLNRHF